MKPKVITDLLYRKPMIFSAELLPPRNGISLDKTFDKSKTLQREKFDFISVTHGAAGSLRAGTLPICFHIQTVNKLIPLAHLTVRNATCEALENILIDHHFLGIHNILALRGDPPDGIGTLFVSTNGGFSYAHEFVSLISNMNSGKYIIRKNFDRESEYREGLNTHFCIGVACYPDDSQNIRIAYLQKKIDAGAHFAITQMILNSKSIFNLLDDSEKLLRKDFPILPGIRIPTSFQLVDRLKNKFRIQVDDHLFNDMQKAQSSETDMLEVGLEWTRNLIIELYKREVPGVHFFVMNDIDSVVKVKNSINFL